MIVKREEHARARENCLLRGNAHNPRLTRTSPFWDEVSHPIVITRVVYLFIYVSTGRTGLL